MFQPSKGNSQGVQLIDSRSKVNKIHSPEVKFNKFRRQVVQFTHFVKTNYCTYYLYLLFAVIIEFYTFDSSC